MIAEGDPRAGGFAEVGVCYKDTTRHMGGRTAGPWLSESWIFE